MGTAEIVGLGAVAGSTILLGLPLGRVRSTAPMLRAAPTALATGILVFLFWDVTTHAVEPLQTRLDAHHWGSFAWLAVLGVVGYGVGLMSLVAYDGRMRRRRASRLVGPGAAAVDEYSHRGLTAGRRLAIMVAAGIGIHNFGEGLAIGQSAAAGEISLAVVLIVGFALHNATEGFGIVGPLAGEAELPSWGFLLALGLLGGGPTMVGTAVGQAWVSPSLQVLFFALAGGSILYVVMQLFEVCRRFSMPQLVASMVLLGLLLGFATDFVLTAAGV